jgi:maltooligosyltrehalose synthase
MSDVWQDTLLEVPKQSSGASYQNVLTRKAVKAEGITLSLQDVLRHFPVGLLQKIM